MPSLDRINDHIDDNTNNNSVRPRAVPEVLPSSVVDVAIVLPPAPVHMQHYDHMICPSCGTHMSVRLTTAVHVLSVS